MTFFSIFCSFRARARGRTFISLEIFSNKKIPRPCIYIAARGTLERHGTPRAAINHDSPREISSAHICCKLRRAAGLIEAPRLYVTTRIAFKVVSPFLSLPLETSGRAFYQFFSPTFLSLPPLARCSQPRPADAPALSTHRDRI